jgi:hypothetical protein
MPHLGAGVFFFPIELGAARMHTNRYAVYVTSGFRPSLACLALSSRSATDAGGCNDPCVETNGAICRNCNGVGAIGGGGGAFRDRDRFIVASPSLVLSRASRMKAGSMLLFRKFRNLLIMTKNGRLDRGSSTYRPEHHYMRGPGPACKRKRNHTIAGRS